MINHKLFLYKMRSLKLSNLAVLQFESYISNRFKQVRNSKGELADWLEVMNGVPEGSTLAPLLFNIYTFDMGSELKHCKCHNHADDFKLYLSGPISSLKMLFEQVQEDIDRVLHWAQNHGLQINRAKLRLLLSDLPFLYHPKQSRLLRLS